MFKNKNRLTKVFLLLLLVCSVVSILAQVPEAQSLASPGEKISLIRQIEIWYINHMNYFVIALLMALESSFLGVIPSELIVSVAAYVALSPETTISFWGVVIFSTIGSLIGGLINYGLAIWLGRKAIYAFAETKTGHFFMLNSKKLMKAEKWFVKYSKVSVCIGRLVPGVRQFISIPAGLSRMNLLKFSFYTFLGSGVWNTVLALLGYFLHGQAELIKKYTFEISYMIVIVLILCIIFLIIRSLIRKNKKNKTMRHFGLVGYPLGHSFSKRYFTDKFKKEKIDASYKLYEYKDLEKIIETIKKDPQLEGLNVTIPYKEKIIPLLDELDEVAAETGAVNVVKIDRTQNTEKPFLKGYNTDIIGFEKSIKPYLENRIHKALVLGTGGASKAVVYVLRKLNVEVTTVSRTEQAGGLTYNEVDEQVIQDNLLIVNTTPLGMHPKENECPDIPYNAITNKHVLYDVIYNPEETLFLKKGREQHARTINGNIMLIEQARAAWRIWNDK